MFCLWWLFGFCGLFVSNLLVTSLFIASPSLMSFIQLTYTYRTSTDDQVNCKNYLECLKKQHQVYFRPLEETTSENFLLVLQTKSQSELMRRYGDEICLLDATYKTTKYSLPMFFVVVPTNTTYQVIATFMVSKETSDAIEEALAILSEWNPQWKPSFWMTDCCAAEQNAVESVFKGKRIIHFNRIRE